MNAGLLIIILLLGLSFLGFPIYLALGIGQEHSGTGMGCGHMGSCGAERVWEMR